MNLQSLAPRFSDMMDRPDSLLHRFWKWWSGEILFFVPPRIREFFDHQDQMLLVSTSDHEMVVEVLHGSDRRELDRISLTSVEKFDSISAYPEADTVIVQLSAAHAFRRQVSLPFGTEDRIDNVLGYEMDRLTPFSQHDVYFHHRVIGRDSERRVINIDLVVALRKIVGKCVRRTWVMSLVSRDARADQNCTISEL